LTSVKFYTSYYKNYFDNFSLYENIPIIDINSHKSNSKIFRISFIGIIRYVDIIKNLIKVIEEESKKGLLVELNFYGGGNDKDFTYLKKQIKNKKLFHFHGPFSYSEDINDIYSNTDLSIALYNPNDFNCQVAIPNKYYESILSNTPIATSKGTYLSEIVKNKKIGFSIDPNNSEEITRFLVNTVTNTDSWYSNCVKNLKATNIDVETNINKVTLKYLKQDDWIN
ncbi:glycosyltransferase, partial [Flavobacteriaceae bacterium]|nr:glycosyltransferase [Flavobacteriaceae bacterium]